MRIEVIIYLFLACGSHFPTGLSRSLVTSDKEMECFSQEKIYHRATDKCYKLLTTGPCRRGHWFVLEKPTEGLRGTLNATIKAKCVKEICPNGEYYWSRTKSCVRSQDKKELCGDDVGEELVTNVFGEGECICTRDPPRARLNGNSSNRCHLLYTQGPCPPSQIFGYSEKTDQAQCTPDPCYAETLYKRQNKIIGKDVVLVAWENGTCYELGTRGPCDEGLTFKVNLSDMTPSCVSLTNSLFQLEKNQHCFEDEEGRCQQVIKPNKNETALNYRKELSKRFIRARKKRTSSKSLFEDRS